MRSQHHQRNGTIAAAARALRGERKNAGKLRAIEFVTEEQLIGAGRLYGQMLDVAIRCAEPGIPSLAIDNSTVPAAAVLSPPHNWEVAASGWARKLIAYLNIG
jgi:hypothetical protein